MGYEWKVTLRKAAIHGGIVVVGIVVAAITTYVSDPSNMALIKAHLPFAAYIVPPAVAAIVAAANNLRKNYDN